MLTIIPIVSVCCRPYPRPAALLPPQDQSKGKDQQQQDDVIHHMPSSSRDRDKASADNTTSSSTKRTSSNSLILSSHGGGGINFPSNNNNNHYATNSSSHSTSGVAKPGAGGVGALSGVGASYSMDAGPVAGSVNTGGTDRGKEIQRLRGHCDQTMRDFQVREPTCICLCSLS